MVALLVALPCPLVACLCLWAVPLKVGLSYLGVHEMTGHQYIPHYTSSYGHQDDLQILLALYKVDLFVVGPSSLNLYYHQYLSLSCQMAFVVCLSLTNLFYYL